MIRFVFVINALETVKRIMKNSKIAILLKKMDRDKECINWEMWPIFLKSLFYMISKIGWVGQSNP